MSNVINYKHKNHLICKQNVNLELQWETFFTNTQVPFLGCGKITLSIRKDWGKWVVINVNKSSCFLVIWWKEILWKFIFCLKSKFLCFILLSVVHFTTQDSTRIDCDLSFSFWIDTTQNKIPVKELSLPSQKQQRIRPHARSKLAQARPPKNGHCHLYLVAYYNKKEV